ncbi:ADP-ribosylglycohydrolase family protein [Streptomyces sp. NPDC007088]|uniref:ADP-ribosylglycohydrolase family protein n=1 Tax=Streptomyces sp. NPDC007088 TaxID=3364773 RepID=UPI0036A8FA7F
MGVTSEATVWGRAEQQDYRSRVRGALLGAALGDALGAPLAGLDEEGLRTVHGPGGTADLLPAHGRRGAVTSVTQLALFSADGLIRAQVRRDTGAWHPPTDLHAAYRRWAATQRDWGPDERRPADGWLARQEWLYARRAPDRDCLTGLGDAAPGTLDHPKNPAARGAAPATRSAPFGLLVGWEPALVLQLAVECAAQTHGHPVSGLVAGAHALLVHGVARGAALEQAVVETTGLLAARPGHEPVTAALARALSGAPAAERPEHPARADARISELLAGGGPENSLSAAVYAARTATDVREGLSRAVRHLGDSSAVGALCGALLGAAHGETALPPGWLAELEGRATILELADDFAMEMTQGASLHSPVAAAPGWLTRYPREL